MKQFYKLLSFIAENKIRTASVRQIPGESLAALEFVTGDDWKAAKAFFPNEDLSYSLSIIVRLYA